MIYNANIALFPSYPTWEHCVSMLNFMGNIVYVINLGMHPDLAYKKNKDVNGLTAHNI